MYNPPPKPARPFAEDYKKGARTDELGNLTHDIEGRPLQVGGRIVGRRVVGGADEALVPQEFDDLTKAALGRGPDILPPNEMGGNMGSVYVNKYSRLPESLSLSNRLTADQRPKVYGHEIGHVVDQLAGEIPVKWIERRPAWEDLTGMRDREPEGSTVHPAVPCPPNWLWAQEHAPNLPVGGSRLIRTGESTTP